jgi:hypothetical protein
MRLADTGLRRIANEMRMWDRCRGKIRHSSRGIAEAASRSLGRRALDRPEEGSLNTYRCPRCLCWHVGHTRRAAPVAGRPNVG